MGNRRELGDIVKGLLEKKYKVVPEISGATHDSPEAGWYLTQGHIQLKVSDISVSLI